MTADMKNLTAFGAGLIFCFCGFERACCMYNDNKSLVPQSRQRSVTIVEPEEVLLERKGKKQAETLVSAIWECDFDAVQSMLKTIKEEGTQKTALGSINLKAEDVNVNVLTVAMLVRGEHSFDIFMSILDCVSDTDDDEVLRNALTVKVNMGYRELIGVTPLSLCVGYEEDCPQYFSPILDVIRGKPYVIAHVLNARMAGVTVLSAAIAVGASEKAGILLDFIKDNRKLVRFVLKAKVNARYGEFLSYTPLMIAVARQDELITDKILKLAIENDMDPEDVLCIDKMKQTEKDRAGYLLSKLQRH